MDAATCKAVLDAMLDELRAIDADKRFHYPCASVVTNAPLALEQAGMETRARHAMKVLSLLGYSGPEMNIRPGPLAKEVKP